MPLASQQLGEMEKTTVRPDEKVPPLRAALAKE
jgi:hypothetical protein